MYYEKLEKKKRFAWYWSITANDWSRSAQKNTNRFEISHIIYIYNAHYKKELILEFTHN